MEFLLTFWTDTNDFIDMKAIFHEIWSLPRK